MSFLPQINNNPRHQGIIESLLFRLSLGWLRLPGLIEIPNVKGLQELYCSNCSRLTEIPNIKELCILNCCNCRKLTKLPDHHNARLLCCSGCVWLNRSNLKFDENITKLKILQNWMKRIIMSKRLNRLIPQLMPLYYCPEAKGGYLHKREMQGFIDSLI